MTATSVSRLLRRQCCSGAGRAGFMRMTWSWNQSRNFSRKFRSFGHSAIVV
jgi:hypothetical protein